MMSKSRILTYLLLCGSNITLLVDGFQSSSLGFRQHSSQRLPFVTKSRALSSSSPTSSPPPSSSSWSSLSIQDSATSSHLSAIRSPDMIESEAPRRPFRTPVKTFTSLQDCMEAVDNPTPGQITIVLFFAHYCKLCHQANIPYKKMAYQNSDIIFSRLETSVMSVRQYKSLGISKVPYLQIYREGICVASFNTEWQLERKLTDALHICQSRSEAEWALFVKNHQSEIETNIKARKQIQYDILHPEEAQQEDALRTLASEKQLLDAIEATSATTATATSTTTDGNDDDGELPNSNSNTTNGNSNSNSNDKPLVVLYHSHFEQACVRAQRQFRRIAEADNNNFIFSRIETSVMSDSSLRTLQVPSFPYIQIYKDGKCVASFSIPQTYLFNQLVRQSLQSVRKRTDTEWDEFYQQFSKEIEENRQAVETVRNNLLSP